MADCTVVIPTYFAGKMLENCVNSILTRSKSANILINKNDVGWLKAANESMMILNTDILLINDDIIALSDLVGGMQELAYSDPQIGIVGGKSLAPDTETIINYGIHIAPDGNTAHKYYGHRRDSVGVEKQRAVEGSAMYIKRAVLESIGYFDPEYIAYREEVDLCFTARKAGWKVMSTPKAEYVHLTSQTHGRLGISNDSHEYFMSKWGKALKLGEI